MGIDQSSKRVALFGGAFNPPHLAHLFTVTYLLSRGDIDEVWILPANKHVFNKQLLPLAQRVQLVEAICSSLTRVKTCLIEAELQLSGRTYDTLETLSRRHKEINFSLVIGSDNLNIADQWYRFDEICKKWPLIVMQRPGYEPNDVASRYRLACDFGPMLPSVSSTELRERLCHSVEENDWRSAPLNLIPRCIRERVVELYTSSEDSMVIGDSQNPSSEGYIKSTHIYSDQSSTDASKELSTLDPNVFIWGQGRCGESLKYALIDAGVKVMSASVRSLLAVPIGDHFSSDQNFDTAIKAKIWLIASRDQDIEPVAKHLYEKVKACCEAPVVKGSTRRLFHTKVVAHCSGLSSRQRLRPLDTLGCDLAVFHPLLSFKNKETPLELIKDAAFLIIGEGKATSELSSLANALGGVTLTPPSSSSLGEQEFQEVYHTAAVMGANLSMLPLMLCEYLLEQLGLEPSRIKSSTRTLFSSALRPYLSATQPVLTEHLLQETALLKFSRELTGPISRADQGTVERHIDMLSHLRDRAKTDQKQVLEETLNLYLSLSLSAANILGSSEMYALIESRLKQERDQNRKK